MFAFNIQGLSKRKHLNLAKIKYIFCQSKVAEGMYLIA